MSVSVPSSREQMLRKLAAERILVLDGAMGTMIQAFGLDEEGYRGARFDAWNREVRGNNDLLNLSQPAVTRQVAVRVLAAALAFVPAMLFGVAAVNKYYDYYQTWGSAAADLTATGLGDVPQLPAGADQQQLARILGGVTGGTAAAQQGETVRLVLLISAVRQADRAEGQRERPPEQERQGQRGRAGQGVEPEPITTSVDDPRAGPLEEQAQPHSPSSQPWAPRR